MNTNSTSGKEIRLTTLSSCAGWASKFSADALAHVMQPLKNIFFAQNYPDLLIGINPPDDAAVWRLNDTQSLVFTTDFFTPVVDEAYDYGAIAATNSLSDIYAMGAKPILALNIAAFPPQLSQELLSEIIRGGGEKTLEAGAVIAGGHTIQDKEPKYGLAVIGLLETKALLTKSAVKSGDVLILTKPLGIGVTTTAIKREKAANDDIDEAKYWMKILNKTASEIAVNLNLKAATDITGFSLLGHANEMSQTSHVKLIIESKNVPFITNAKAYGLQGFFAGGASDNRMHFRPFIEFASNIDEVTEMLLFDPQTSGGLLIACPEEKVSEFERKAKSLNQPFWIIGKAIDGKGIHVV